MIEFKCNEQYFGFLLEQIQPLPDIHATGFLFSHQQSGARLYYIKTEDDNKVFSITFKTPPEDDCGTPHILEHSVLCGSRKYGVKDPFNELAKGSLHTYLNALTYGDKTMYPVASRNEKDLMNMMDVYLDAVFYPRIDEIKEIFLQEGWHYEWDKEGALSISGVVYNEMKGALSDPEAILQNCIARSLFKSSIYGLESGGDPDCIPDLSYEQFLAFHKKYYHPSNSFLYLYGDMDAAKQMEYIDKEYLSHFHKTSIDTDIALDNPMEKSVTVYDTYPVEIVKDDKQSFLSFNIKAGYCTDPERIMALQILDEILMETNASPLKKALIQSGIVVDAEGWLDSSALEMTYSIVGKKANMQHLPKFQEIIEKTLQGIVENGVDRKLLDSCMQKFEFYYREEDFGSRPKGLTYCMQMMRNWLHGADPCQVLNYRQHFDKMKEQSHKGYFEKLIQTLFIDNTQKSFVAIEPKAGKQTEMNNAFYEKMAQTKAAMSQEEIDAINADLKKLTAFQTKEETPEELSKIPMLAISDIDKSAETISLHSSEKWGYPVLYSPLETNQIIYLQFLFDTSGLPERLLPYAGLLAHVLGKLDTERYSYDTLPVEIGLYTGGIHCTNDVYSSNPSSCKPFFAVNGKALVEKQQNLVDLLEEILLKTDFKSIENLKKIIGIAKIKREGQLLNNSHTIAILKSASAIATGSYRKDMAAGIGLCHFLESLDLNNMELIVSQLQETLSILLNKQNVTIAFACEKESAPAFLEILKKCVDKLPDHATQKESLPFNAQPVRQAFTGSSKVQYNALCRNYLADGFTYSGAMRVLKTILDLEYLWNRVRVQGGAYGSGCNFLRNGNFYFYSYRDPNIENTYEAYKNAGVFLEAFCSSAPALDKFILGAINALDQPKSNADKFDTALARYFDGVTDERLQTERDEILKTDISALVPYISLLKAITLNNICTIGNNDAIQKSKEFFDNMQPLIP